MTVVQRNILKSFFIPGATPTSAQFNTLIDSTLNLSDDKYLLGLKNYDATLIYVTGDTIVHNGVIYQAKATTTAGTFNISDWNAITGNTPGAIVYKGTWDADSDIPVLETITPATGDYYVVSEAGYTTLNAPPNEIDHWDVGDWAIYNGTLWQKIINPNSVSDAANVDGDGVGIYQEKDSSVLKFKKLTNENDSVTIADSADTVDLSINFDDAGTSASRSWSAYKINEALGTKQDTLDFTPEDVANKVTEFSDEPSDTNYPSEKLVADNFERFSHVENIQNKLGTESDPTPSYNSSQGYSIGSRWINYIAQKEFVFVAETSGAAVWKETTSSGGGGGGSLFGSQYHVLESTTLKSTSSGTPLMYMRLSLDVGAVPSGNYRVQWSCIMSNEGIGQVFLYEAANSVTIGPVISYAANDEHSAMPLGGTANVDVNTANKTEFSIRFNSDSGEVQNISYGRIELFRIS